MICLRVSTTMVAFLLIYAAAQAQQQKPHPVQKKNS